MAVLTLTPDLQRKVVIYADGSCDLPDPSGFSPEFVVRILKNLNQGTFVIRSSEPFYGYDGPQISLTRIGHYVELRPVPAKNCWAVSGHGFTNGAEDVVFDDLVQIFESALDYNIEQAGPLLGTASKAIQAFTVVGISGYNVEPANPNMPYDRMAISLGNYAVNASVHGIETGVVTKPDGWGRSSGVLYLGSEGQLTTVRPSSNILIVGTLASLTNLALVWRKE